MLDWKPIFTGSPESARDLAEALARHGLRSFVEDRRGAVLSSSGVREPADSMLLVPPEEFEAATAVAHRWNTRNEREVSRLSRRMGRILLLASAPPAAWLATSWVLGRSVEGHLGWLASAWLLSLVVAARLEHRASSL